MATIDTHPDPSLVQIIKDLRDDTTTLFRQEVALVKREMATKAATYGRNVAFLAVAAVVAVYALLFILLFGNNLLQTGLLAAGMSDSTSSWLAPLLVGMVLGLGALFLTLKALRSLGREKPVPEKTLESIREDKDWIKGKLQR